MNLSRTAALAGGLSILLTLAGPGLAHFRVVAPIAGFGLFMLGLLLGVAALVLGWAGLSQARRTREPRRPALLGLIAGILVCSFLSVLVMTRGFARPLVSATTSRPARRPGLMVSTRRPTAPTASWSTS